MYSVLIHSDVSIIFRRAMQCIPHVHEFTVSMNYVENVRIITFMICLFFVMKKFHIDYVKPQRVFLTKIGLNNKTTYYLRIIEIMCALRCPNDILLHNYKFIYTNYREYSYIRQFVTTIHRLKYLIYLIPCGVPVILTMDLRCCTSGYMAHRHLISRNSDIYLGSSPIKSAP